MDSYLSLLVNWDYPFDYHREDFHHQTYVISFISIIFSLSILSMRMEIKMMMQGDTVENDGIVI